MFESIIHEADEGKKSNDTQDKKSSNHDKYLREKDRNGDEATSATNGVNGNIPWIEANVFDTSLNALREEESHMREQEYKNQRDMATINDDMIEDVIHLLELFGLPYLRAPTEAEAQCAMLEKLGLVHGVVTEDSDGKMS